MRICPRCGCQNMDDSLFCISCGSDLEQEHMRTQQVQKKASPLVGVLVVLIVFAIMAGAWLFIFTYNLLQEKTETQTSMENNSNDDVFPPNPVHHCTKEDDDSDYTDWSYIYFGSYPQSEVPEESLTSEIVHASYDENGDAWVGNVRYRRSDTEGYRYYKWEPIKWRVLQNDGSSLFVLADQALDERDYHEENVAVTWEDCTLREWLNTSFYNAAFSDNEQEIILEQKVVNEDNPYFNTEGGKKTKDFVYLLSFSDVTRPDYGFCEDYSTKSASRRMQHTDYITVEDDSVEWLLRTPGYDDVSVTHVGFNGFASREGGEVCEGLWSDGYVVPALHIKLDSDLWSVDESKMPEQEHEAGSEEVVDISNDIDYVKIAKCEHGYGRYAAISENGNLYMWGSNYGYIDDSGTENYSYENPQLVMTDVKDVVLEDYSMAIIKNDGSLYIGADEDVFVEGSASSEYVFQKVMDNVKSVIMNNDVTFAVITNNGELYIWGYGGNGAMGGRDRLYEPKKMLDNVSEVQFAPDSGAVGALTNDKKLYIWGNNEYYQRGREEYGSGQDVILENVVQFDFSSTAVAAVTTDGSLYVWGDNEERYPVLGDEDTVIITPKKILDNIKMAYLNGSVGMAVSTNGKLYTWGAAILNGTEKEIYEPTVLLTDIEKAYFAGNGVCVAISVNGKLWTWGRGTDYQLGNKQDSDFGEPTIILENIKEVENDDFYVCAIDNDGKLYHWGTIWYGSSWKSIVSPTVLSIPELGGNE